MQAVSSFFETDATAIDAAAVVRLAYPGDTAGLYAVPAADADALIAAIVERGGWGERVPDDEAIALSGKTFIGIEIARTGGVSAWGNCRLIA